MIRILIFGACILFCSIIFKPAHSAQNFVLKNKHHNNTIPQLSDTSILIANAFTENSVNDEIRIFAGNDQKICNDITFLNALNTDNSEGKWNIHKGTGNIWDVYKSKTLVTDLGYGENIFRWSVKTPAGIYYDDVTIYNYSVKAFAGKDQEICGQETVLKASNPGKCTGEWSVMKGSGDFYNKKAFTTQINNVGNGINQYKWTVTNKNCSSASIVTVKNNKFDIELIEVNHISCHKQNDGHIEVKAIGTKGTVKYRWNDRKAQNGPKAINLQAGEYTVKVTDEFCTTDFKVNIKDVSPLKSEIIKSTPVNHCDSCNGTFELLSYGGNAPYKYHIKSLNYTTENPVFKTLCAGHYKVNTIDANGCNVITKVRISNTEKKHELPEIIGQKQAFKKSEAIVYAVKPIGKTYSWVVENGSIIEIADTAIVVNWGTRDYGKISLTIDYGCNTELTKSLFVELINSDKKTKITNVLTPNGDGRNDVFIINEIEDNFLDFSESELIIFNQYGKIVYRVSPYYNDWNGRNNSGQKLDGSVYFYLFRKNKSDKNPKKGSLYLIR